MMSDVICLDSDSDFESSPPKNARTTNTRARRKTRRGRQGKAGQSTSSKENASNQINSSVSSTLIDLVSSPQGKARQSSSSIENASYQINSTVSCTHTDLVSSSPANVPSLISRNSSVDSLSVTAPVSSDHRSEDGISGKPLPDCLDKCSSKTKEGKGSTQSRKTARRGLARKTTCSDPTALTPSEASTESMIHRKASVYSDERVSHVFQNIYGAGSQLKDNPDTVKESEELSHPEDKKVEAQQQVEGHVLSSSDESAESVHEAGHDPSFVRSPTPPPEMKKDKPHRISRRAQKALKTLNSVKARIDVAQRRNEPPPVALLVDSPVVKSDMIIKVRFLSKVYRLRHNLNHPFHQLLTKVSREIGKREDHLGLFLNDSSLPLTSTPKNVNLSVADIIECYDVTETGGNLNKGDSVNVVIQCSNSKKKTTLTAYKRLPIQDLMDRYASKLDLDISTFTFYFDGEYVSPLDTLLKLDIEEGDVLDVVPKTDGKASSAYAHQTQVITLM